MLLRRGGSAQEVSRHQKGTQLFSDTRIHCRNRPKHQKRAASPFGRRRKDLVDAERCRGARIGICTPVLGELWSVSVRGFLTNGPLPAFADHYFDSSTVASIAFRTTSGINGPTGSVLTALTPPSEEGLS